MAKRKNVEFDAMRTKGNNTGVDKNGNRELREAMVQAVVEQFDKVGLKGVRACFAIGENVYALCLDTRSAFQRSRLTGNALGLLSPLSKPQARDLAASEKPLCTYSELKQAAENLQVNDLGTALEYVWAKKNHKPFNHKAAWHTGKNDCPDKYEMKLFNFNTTSGSPTVRFTTRKTLEKLGYDFSEYED